MSKWHIYKVENPMGLVYIGASNDISARLRNHKAKTNHYSLLSQSIEMYGYESHVFSVIDIAESKIESECKEMFWIRTYMCNRNKFPEMNGLNKTDGGVGAYGHTGAFKGAKKPKEMCNAISRGKFKKVFQYTLDNVFVREYESGLSAAKEHGVTNKAISRAALGKIKTCKGYIFRYD